MVDYSETIEVYGIKVGIYIVNKTSKWRHTCTRGQGQGHSLTIVQGHSDFINFKQLSNSFCLETFRLTAAVKLHDKDGRHAHNWLKTLKSSFSEPNGQYH